jgi:hypothetical protein
MPSSANGIRRKGLALAVALALLAGGARAAETVEHPFVGVEHITRVETTPRPVRMHVIVIELKAPGIRFLLTPHAGPQDTLKETTLQFLTEQKAQIAINAHFFEPWPAPSPDPGSADLVGLAASNGQVYSPFDAHPPKPQAIRPNAPAINIDPDNIAAVVHRDAADANGYRVAEAGRLYNALAGNEQILTRGEITAGTGTWDNTPNPRTVIGLSGGGRLILLVVDGRQKGVSEGLTTGEAAEVLRRDYGAADALNLDGGGSTTLCLADPAPRVANVPVGAGDAPGSLRAVGSNLAVFARAMDANGPAAATSPFAPDAGPRTWALALAGLVGFGMVLLIRKIRDATLFQKRK